MKNKSMIAVGLVVVVVLGIIISAVILQPEKIIKKGFDAEEITMQEVPTSIQKEMQASLEERGTHFYRQENGDTVYALLTAGTIMGRTLVVEPSAIKDGIYFTAKFIESSGVAEALQYKIYRTKATSVAGDDYLLQNPYLKVGAKGLNSGYLQHMTQGYYVLPLMDTDGLNRVYGTSENTKNLTDGLYEFTYELTETGAKLLTATPIDSCTLGCTVISFTDGPKPSVSIRFGTHKLKADLLVTDDDILATLRKNDFKKSDLQTECTIEFTNQLILTDLQVLSFVEK